MNVASEELGEFFDYFWADDQCWVYLPILREPYDPKTDWKKFMFQWPRQRQGVIRHVLRHNSESTHVFFSPAEYRMARATRDMVIGARVLWVDFDGNAPQDWSEITDIPAPTLRVQSSSDGREHVYWRLNEFITDLDWLEDRNRAIAYKLGADTSGWDADQVLRPIHTTNYKNGLPVHVKEWDR